jgi:hypothetical protein
MSTIKTLAENVVEADVAAWRALVSDLSEFCKSWAERAYKSEAAIARVRALIAGYAPGALFSLDKIHKALDGTVEAKESAKVNWLNKLFLRMDLKTKESVLDYWGHSPCPCGCVETAEYIAECVRIREALDGGEK